MKTNKNYWLMLFMAGWAVMSSTEAQASVRDTIDINWGWQFHRGDIKGISQASDDIQNHSLLDEAMRGCEVINLPHDFQLYQPWVAPGADERANSKDAANNVKSRLSARGFKEMGIGWYRYELTPQEEWKGRRVMLDFGGIMLVGDVYVNGQHVAATDYGYLGFDIDVSPLLRYGEKNEIAVRADTRAANNSRWYTGGGLFRDVRLIVTNDQLYFPRHPLYITTRNNREVNIRAEIVNRQKKQKGESLGSMPIEVKILDMAGRVVAQQKTDMPFNAKWRDREYELPAITLEGAQLWSCDRPYLYTVEVTLYDKEGRVADKTREHFGMRTIELSPQHGLLLNGQKVLLKGYANHHTLGALGAAAYPRAIEQQLLTMKRFGFNHIRTSHNPYSEDLLRLCDQYGILVVDELYDKWNSQFTGGRADFLSLWQKNIPEWVKRDRNHPCVVLWSLGNELQHHADMPFNDWGVTLYRLMRQLLHRYDHTRLTTVAMHPRYRNIDTDSLPADLAVATEVNSYNYRYMYFPGDMKRYPEKIFYQSEASTEAMGPNFFEMELDKVMGLAYWGAVDYLGESLGWPLKGWNKGVFDMTMLPKPDAYFVKSMFSDEPLVHIGIIEKAGTDTQWNGINVATQRLSENWNRTQGEQLSLYTYTNADEVELLLNGRSLGVRKNDADPKLRNRIRWDAVPYEPGTLVAVARKAGKVVARHQLATTGEAVALRLEPESRCWQADGKDLQFVRVTATDRKGRRVLSAHQLLQIELKGEADIVAVGNGDMASSELPVGDKQLASHASRSLYEGAACIVLRSRRQAGKVELKVKSGKLSVGSLRINIQ